MCRLPTAIWRWSTTAPRSNGYFRTFSITQLNSPRQGEITINVGSVGGPRQLWNLKSVDTGAGIEQNKIATIFEPFHQADNSSRRAFSGLGLGLTVARRMADLIGGKLSITSNPNVGTRVLMSFPAQAALACRNRENMLNPKFIRCRNCDAVHHVTAFDKAPSYSVSAGKPTKRRPTIGMIL